VNFVDQSGGVVDAYEWDLGDGTITSEQNPVHTYNQTGVYSVKQTVSNSIGTSEETKNGYITVLPLPPAPAANFKTDKRTGPAPLTVQFQDTASGEITRWNWDFGDGNISTERDPVNTYQKPGVYSVSESVTGPGGSDLIVRRGYIIVSGPSTPLNAASYAQPQSGTAPLTVRFLDISSGSVSGWNWDFGDGTTSNNKNPTHVYQEPGQYSVTLQIEGNDGVSLNETVIDVGPSEFIRTGNRQSSFEADQVINESGNPGQLPENLSGDEKRNDTTEPDRPLLVNGSSSSREKGRPAISEPLKADFNIGTREGNAPLAVSFTDLSTGEITRWNWSFGDGMVSEEKNPVHTYMSSGIYPVSLSVTGPEGGSSKRLWEGIIVR
jgi:PKD repeat protein